MVSYQGKSALKKIATGPVFVLDRVKIPKVCKLEIKDITGELKKLSEAIKAVDEELADMQKIASDNADKDASKIFDAYRTILIDDSVINDLKIMIKEEAVCAEYAVSVVSEKYSTVFEGINDETRKARALDIRDISTRLINHLLGKKNIIDIKNPSIVVATEISPSDTVSVDRNKVKAFVSRNGSLNSHCAVLARTMGIPYVICQNLDSSILEDGLEAIVDGENGLFVVEPDANTRIMYSGMLYAQDYEKMRLSKFRNLESVSAEGRKVSLYANISGLQDIDSCHFNTAEGIGLFRTEFLFVNRDTPPTESEQYDVYFRVITRMNNKPVSIRTLDVGADKIAGYFDFLHEDNPALGLRGIRYCLTHREIFKTQLKALFKASVFGDVSVMFPMITSVKELDEVNAIVKEVDNELKRSGAVYKIPRLGIIIETPAAVMISDELAKRTEFFSIGTNDLTQYTLAMDRLNSELDEVYDSHHPAVLKMISIAVENAHRNYIPVGICGDLASDENMTDKFMMMGVDALSVSPDAILKIREKVVTFKNT